MSGRLRQSLRARGAQAEAASEDVRDVEVSLTAQVASAYLALRGAQERLAVAQRNAENQRRTLEITQRRLEAGRGTQLDTERAKSQLSATLAAIPTLEAAIESGRQRLRVLTGRSRLDELALPPCAMSEDRPCEMSVELPDAPTLGAVDQVVRDRPDVRSAERQLDASRAFVGAARAGVSAEALVRWRGRLHRQRGARARQHGNAAVRDRSGALVARVRPRPRARQRRGGTGGRSAESRALRAHRVAGAGGARDFDRGLSESRASGCATSRKPRPRVLAPPSWRACGTRREARTSSRCSTPSGRCSSGRTSVHSVARRRRRT